MVLMYPAMNKLSLEVKTVTGELEEVQSSWEFPAYLLNSLARY